MLFHQSAGASALGTRPGIPKRITRYCSGTISSLRIENGSATDVQREPFHVDQLTSFGEDARGELYLATGGGRIYKLGG